MKSVSGTLTALNAYSIKIPCNINTLIAFSIISENAGGYDTIKDYTKYLGFSELGHTYGTSGGGYNEAYVTASLSNRELVLDGNYNYRFSGKYRYSIIGE